MWKIPPRPCGSSHRRHPGCAGRDLLAAQAAVRHVAGRVDGGSDGTVWRAMRSVSAQAHTPQSARCRRHQPQPARHTTARACRAWPRLARSQVYPRIADEYCWTCENFGVVPIPALSKCNSPLNQLIGACQHRADSSRTGYQFPLQATPRILLRLGCGLTRCQFRMNTDDNVSAAPDKSKVVVDYVLPNLS